MQFDYFVVTFGQHEGGGMWYAELSFVAGSRREAKGKCKVVPVLFFLTEHHAMKAYWGSGGVTPLILDLGSR
jgi:hypothetical protein